jgi:hypothetical protein
LASKEAEQIMVKKSVRFDKVIRLCLIATRADYIQAGVRKDLWYLEEDFLTFKFEAAKERRSTESAALELAKIRAATIGEVENNSDDIDIEQSVDSPLEDIFIPIVVEESLIKSGMGNKSKSMMFTIPKNYSSPSEFKQVDDYKCIEPCSKSDVCRHHHSQAHSFLFA